MNLVILIIKVIHLKRKKSINQKNIKKIKIKKEIKRKKEIKKKIKKEIKIKKKEDINLSINLIVHLFRKKLKNIEK